MEGMSHQGGRSEPFPTEIEGLPEAAPTTAVVLDHGDRLDLRIGPVAKRIGEHVVRMLAYDGSIPGPTLRVRQGSTIVVDVTNDGDVEATVHWHGLRLRNRYDGVPHDTQKPIPVGGTFTYEVDFPDEGLYWYHPHIREDYTQEMGLAGNIVVTPSDDAYWPPADRDLTVMLDDLLMEGDHIAPHDPAGADHMAMGRFGNVLLVNGEVDPTLDVRTGEVVRFFLTNVANTRVFNVHVGGGRMKLVGGDSGRYERETFVDEVLLAPSERAVVDVLFETEGSFRLEHRTPDRTYEVAHVVCSGRAEHDAAGAFDELRVDGSLTRERETIAPDRSREPDKILALVAEMDMPPSEDEPGYDGPHRFACPMDPEVVSIEPGRCPTCGMKLLPIAFVPAAIELLRAAADGSPDHGDHAHEAGGIEWEDTMEEINRLSNASNMRWLLVDRTTDRRNAAIDWTFAIGDRVKIRLVNEMDSDHPMHHPFHIHGAGRFLVLSRNGVPDENLVWKDTVLVRTGEIVDILLDVSNPGLWMAHCHIAEHIESGMMFSFRVTG
jgi:FtsP/CotA-like multicopper oxidase with cupredoxin domain